jgi:putative flippase GtrA
MNAQRFFKLLKFLAAGLPSFLLAVPLNYFAVDFLKLPPAPVYAVVLVLQVTVNFFMCRWFVFEKRSDTPMWKEFGTFATGILVFRLADWALYTFAVNVLGLYYIAIQLVNVVLFSVLKFLFSERTLR